jgi:hypothetical protein
LDDVARSYSSAIRISKGRHHLASTYIIALSRGGCHNSGVRNFFNLRIIFVALVVLILIGMIGFHVLEGWSWFDGFYMVLTTISTIGYGEIHPLSHAGRIFNAFIIITGVGLVLLFFGGATQALLEFELQSVFGRRQSLVRSLHSLRRRPRRPQCGS